MGDDEKTPLKLNFDPKVHLDFRGATITSDAGLLACRELDHALGLTDSSDDFLKESRTGKNIRHKLIALLRQSVFSRLAGYDDTNDADRLSQDPAMRVVVGWKSSDRKAASASEMGVRDGVANTRRQPQWPGEAQCRMGETCCSQNSA